MLTEIINSSADVAWARQLKATESGQEVVVRGLPTFELVNKQTCIDMHWPVVTNTIRQLNYKFMIAEALWILRGSQLVADIATYNKNLLPFSDDGIIFQGAYGPRVVEQMNYVVQALVNDPFTRQAVIEIWRPNPRPSKDIPCTVCLHFLCRNSRLNTIAYMRSSDVWLGLPYDMFNFTMITYYVLARWRELCKNIKIGLGTLTIIHGSLHLYVKDLVDAGAALKAGEARAYSRLNDETFKTGDGLLRWLTNTLILIDRNKHNFL